MNPQWVELKYPKTVFETYQGEMEFKGKSDGLNKAKQELERSMMLEVARQIFTRVSSQTVSTTNQRSDWDAEGISTRGSSAFSEDVQLQVRSEFSTELLETWQHRRTLHGIIVINKRETSLKLVKSAEAIFAQAISRAEEQLRSKNTQSLSEIEAELQRGSDYLNTVIWLNPQNEDIKSVQDMAATLAGLIERLNGSGSEDKFRQERANVADFIQEGAFEEADQLLDRLAVVYDSRDEVDELREILKERHREYAENECMMAANPEDSQCIAALQAYLRIYPNDRGMQSLLVNREREVFEQKLHELEVALDNSRLDLAGSFISEIEDMVPYRDESSFRKLKDSYMEAKVDLLIKSAELKLAANKPHEAWREINSAINQNYKLLDNGRVMNKRAEIGRECADADIRAERDKAYYRLAILAGMDFRTNGALWSDVIEKISFEPFGGIQAYTFGIYRRRVDVDKMKVSIEEGKKQDKSSDFHLNGLKFTVLQFDTYRHWADSTSDAHLSSAGETLNVSLDFVTHNFVHFSVGAETPFPLDVSTSNWKCTAAVGLQFSKKLRRGMIALRGDVLTLTDLKSPPIMHLQTGLSWVPFFLTKVENKAAYQNKYK